MSRHQSREQLLRHLDGELSRFAAWQTAAHLKSCWACQVEFEHLKEEISAIVDAQSAVEPTIPPPPGPWSRLEPRLERARLDAVPAWKKAGRFSGRAFRQLAYSGTFLVIAGVGLSLWVGTRPVSAKEILTRVTAADRERLAITERQVIRQRVRVEKISGDASPKSARLDSWKSATSTYWDSKDETSAELLERYKSYGLESALPLSGAAIGAWVTAAGDEPSATGDRGLIDLEVRSDAKGRARGLERVSLHIMAEDWHLQQMTLTFTDTTYQITEEESSIIAREDVPRDVMARLTPYAEASSARVAPSSPVNPQVSSASLDDVEMEVRYGLHQIGADLGEAIEIVPEPPDRLRVEAQQVSPEIREKLVALLQGRNDVQLEFPAVAGSPPAAGARRILSQTSSLRTRPDPRIVTFFGSAEAQENYARSVLETTTCLLTRLYALRELAERWTADREQGLSADSKTKLDMIVQDHVSEILNATSELEKQVAPLMEHFGVPAARPIPSDTGASWREASNSGLDAVRRADRVLRALLTSSDSPLAIEEAIPQLQQSLDDVQRAAKQL